MVRTPKRQAPSPPSDDCLFTPPMKQNLRHELKEALMKRNALTEKSKSKAISILDDICSSPETTPTKPKELRRRAIDEILTSEKRYIQQLQTLIEYFIEPLKGILDMKSHTALFGQIEMIYNLNRELLEELEADLNNVSKAFLKLAPFFKLYSVYAFDYKNSLLLLQDMSTKNLIFKKFLDDTETRPEVQMKLNSLMITPIQRIPRYRLLLQQVQLYTSPSDPDHRFLMESIKEIENTVQHINSVVEDQEHTQSLINLQNSLVNRSPSIVKPCRRIIKEGVLSRVLATGGQQKYFCVLMSDIFMYCKVLKKRAKDVVVENSLQCVCIFPLRKSKVSEMFSANFKLSCQGEGVIFHAENDQQCHAWVSQIKEVISVMVESRKTLRKESSRKRPVKKGQLKYFETEYILSPQQKGNKYDYENLYKCADLSEMRSDLNKKSKIRKLVKQSKTKRSSHSDDEQPRNGLEAPFVTVFSGKQPSPKISAFSKFKSWFNFGSSSTNSKSTANQNSNQDSNHDPTYGFASRPTHQSYFRTSNVDSAIQHKLDFNSVVSAMGVQLEQHDKPNENDDIINSNVVQTNKNKKDMLFPLREAFQRRDVVVKSGEKRKSEEINDHEDHKEIHNENHLMTNSNSKRVKFDEQEHVATESFFENRRQDHVRQYGEKHSIPQFKPIPNNSNMSLKNKIIDFFSSLI